MAGKFGIPPASIPDYLALVGDSADGVPGIAGWGAKSTAAVLARYGKLERIPAEASRWEATVRGAARLSANLEEGRERAMRWRACSTKILAKSFAKPGITSLYSFKCCG